MSCEANWTAIVPVKKLAIAKSRLGGPASAEFAQSFARDVIDACVRSVSVKSVIVVGSDASLLDGSHPSAHFLLEDDSDGSSGLNQAVKQAMVHARDRETTDIVILTGDLPSLRPESVDALLALAPNDAPSFVTDHIGSGTSALLAPHSTSVTSQFGIESARAHSTAGYRDMSSAASADLRLDVDTMSDLQSAVALGVGLHTRRALKTIKLEGHPMWAALQL